MIFVDTNYFLRFLTKDVTRQYEKAKKLFDQGALGKTKLFTSLVVIFEIYWVLSSFYNKNKEIAYKTLKEIFVLGFIKIEQRKLLEKALIIFSKTNLDLEDAYNLVYAKKLQIKTMATFDKQLEKKFKESSF